MKSLKKTQCDKAALYLQLYVIRLAGLVFPPHPTKQLVIKNDFAISGLFVGLAVLFWVLGFFNW